ncbi:MAG TPA: site-specific integrase, partial [Candidatus Limnocylindria bacterium]
MATTTSGRLMLTDGAGGANDLTLDAALPSYARHLRAANRSPRTIKTYLNALDGLRRFLAANGMPTGLRAIRREHLEAYLVALQEGGKR